jgi:hypothetical protein
MLNLQNFEKIGHDLASRTTMPTLRFSDGSYHFSDGETFVENVRLVANMRTLRIGWVRWNSGFPVKRIMGEINEGFLPPERVSDKLGDFDKELWESKDGIPEDPWRITLEIVAYHPDTDSYFLLVFDNLCHRTVEDDAPTWHESLGVLAQVYAVHARSAPDELPLIELGRDSFVYGPVSNPIIHYVPRINVVGWWSAAKEREAIAKHQEVATKKWEAATTDEKKRRRSK